MDYEKVHKAAITLGRELIKKNPELKDWAFKIMPDLRTTEEQELIDKIINLIQEVQNDEIQEIENDEYWHIDNWSDDAIKWLKAKRETAGQHSKQRKFKIGDYVVGKFLRGRVTAITDNAYLLNTDMGFTFTEEDNVHLWSVEDIHPGDVITDGCGITILFKKWFDYHRGEAVAYAGIDSGETLQLTEDNDAHWTLKGVIRPATNEEIDKLNSLLSNAGYGWNSMTKEIFKIENLGSEMNSVKESLEISTDKFYEIVNECLYGDGADPCEDCEEPKLNCHNFPCYRKKAFEKYCRKFIGITWHSIKVPPKYPCDILFVSNVGNIFLYHYMEDGRPVDRETPYFHNLIDGKWCDCKDIISGEPQHIWSKEAVISALTEELTKRIQPLHENSFNKKLTDYERGELDALVILRSFINSPEFNIGSETKKTAWTPHDDTMLIYAQKYLDDMLRKTPSEERQLEIIDAINWLSDIKKANMNTRGTINVDEMVSERSRKYTETHKELNLYRKGIEDTLKKLKIE